MCLSSKFLILKPILGLFRILSRALLTTTFSLPLRIHHDMYGRESLSALWYWREWVEQKLSVDSLQLVTPEEPSYRIEKR